MYRFYFCILIIIVNGFIPSGKINAVYTLIAWILLITQILSDIKFQNKNPIKLIPIILLLSFIGAIIYIFPYSQIYNIEAMEDTMITMFNVFLYLIIGIQFRIFLDNHFKKYKFNNQIEVFSSLNNILNLQKINLFMNISLIIVIPYLTKLIFFREENLLRFFNPMDFSYKFKPALSYSLPMIDFSSINFLSLSFNHSTRNSFILIPLIFIFISYKFLKIINENEAILIKYLDNLAINNLLNKIRISYIFTYLFSTLYLLCSSTRVGICIGYALLTLLFFSWRILCKDNEFLVRFRKPNLKNSLIPRIISIFLIIIFIVPYQVFFPYTCRKEYNYNSIITNSSLPIIYETRVVINYLLDKDEVPKNQFLCSKPYFPLPNEGPVFSEYNSSSFLERLKIYTSDSDLDKDKYNDSVNDKTPIEKIKPLIRHESLIRDILYPFKLVKLTIPISIIFLIFWLTKIMKYMISTFNRKNALIDPEFKIKNLDNLIPLIGSSYFLFNSVNSPSVAICFGIFYVVPTINFLTSLRKFANK